MNEDGWLASQDPAAMLAYIQDKASARQLRLFACACARQVWDQLTNPQSRRAVEIAERYADGEATVAELRTARDKAHTLGMRADAEPSDRFAHAAWSCCVEWDASGQVANLLQRAVFNRHPFAEQDKIVAAAQAALLREICGNPWQLVRLCDGPRRVYRANQEPTWLDISVFRWHDATVPRLAQTMYSRGDFSAMSILGDALEDAGVTDNDILAHARSAGPHVKGCWLIDLLLGKE